MVTVSGRERGGTAGSQQEIMQVRSNGIPGSCSNYSDNSPYVTSLSLSVPKERTGGDQTSPLYTPFIPPGIFMTTVNSSAAFVEGGGRGGAAAVGSGRGRGETPECRTTTET